MTSLPESQHLVTPIDPVIMTAKLCKIDERNGGCGVIFEDRLYVWGGETTDKESLLDLLEGDEDDGEDTKDSDDFAIDTVVTLPRPNDQNHPFDVFDFQTSRWSSQATRGGSDVPSSGLGSSLVVHPTFRCIYLYGGWNEGRFDSEVYRMSVDTWEWEIVQPVTAIKPSPRYLTAVFIHKAKLCMFGGVGVDIVEGQDPGARYNVAYTDAQGGVDMGFGWNNEYYEFDLSSGAWTAPLGADAIRPLPMGGMAFTKIDRHRALLFGGRCVKGRMDEVYMFDLDLQCLVHYVYQNTSNLRRNFDGGPIKCSSPSQPWPIGRTFATLTPLIEPEMVGQRLCGCGPVLRQRVLLLWGKNLDRIICDEAWILDVETQTWIQLSIDMKPRSWHIAQPLYNYTSTECWVAIFGGNVHVEGMWGDRKNAADLTILSFGVRTLMSIALSVIVKSEKVMSEITSLPPKLQTQIVTAYNAHNCNIPHPTIADLSQ